jgi:hypothetical protein
MEIKERLSRVYIGFQVIDGAEPKHLAEVMYSC